ncbi:DNA polymerase I [uncultured Alistipes sp.]|uniref:DNA polymerase I n=1 Tax=uncultured Alistipes sp. TaxID=538949 RepID=UPI0026239A5D|nr:DNA polymerase I [uncultured Alistipes sp.]
MERVFLVDAYALIFRFYYAFINRPMRNAAGVNTSAVFGFVRYLNDLIRREKPDCLGVAFDPPGGNFRHELYPAYKANRSETPEDIVASVPYIKRLLEAMRIPVIEVPGYEADDVIGTLSQKAAAAGYEVFMVTPDKDYGQLIRPTVHIYKQKKGGDGIEIVGCGELCEHYGIDDPCRIVDILALWGDASDNIPGVPGIGEKSAAKLVCRFGPVEELLSRTDELKGKQRENIEAAREQIMLAKRLATIELDVPVAFEPEKLALEEPDTEALRELYRELGFRSLEAELSAGGGVAAGAEKGGGTPADDAAGRVRSAKTAASAVPDLFSALDGGAAAPAEAGLFDAPAFDTVSTVPHTYRTVDTPEALAELAARLSGVEAFCFDTETTGFDVFGDRLVGLSFAVEPFEAWYVPCDPENTPRVLDALRPVFEDERIAKIGQNVKFDLMVLRSAGVEVKGLLYDTMIIHYLLDPESRHGMDHLARTYLNYSPVPIEELIGKGARQITMDRVPVERCAEYAAEDADVTLRLKLRLWPMLEEAGLVELYRTIEEPLIRVLADIERAGVRIDTDALAASGRQLASELAELEERIREAAGDPSLNVNSAKQLGEALFGRLKIDPKPRMTKTKQYRTDEEYLQMLSDRHPVVGMILEYRGLRKLLSTYVEALPLLVNPVTGRIHTSFNQAVTATGRLSSTNPNLQNIPIRDERGREIRRAFVPSDDDHLLLSADYSQVELRLMAHLSEDPTMIAAFSHGADIHTETAARVFGVPVGEVTREQRRRAKTANFGIIYGISAFGLAQRLRIPRSEAKAIIDGYFATYPGVKAYMERVVSEARQRGYVSTLFGRKRMLPDIRSGNAVVRGLSERNAINAPIQGGAADIMKLAMIAVHSELNERGLLSKIILQVHDELVIDMLRSEASEVQELVVRCMEEAAKLRVALIAECGVGANWVEAH